MIMIRKTVFRIFLIFPTDINFSLRDSTLPFPYPEHRFTTDWQKKEDFYTINGGLMTTSYMERQLLSHII